MYASGIADVPVEHTKITVNIDTNTLPDYYIVKAYLVDSVYAPLCDAYESLMYTHAYEEFLAVTPDDYQGEEVIVFDDNKEQADFAVLDGSAIISETSEDMTFEYDELTLTFTFYNAIDDVKNLTPGDIYYYEYGTASNEFLLFKVKSVTVNDKTVTIVQDENISLSEVFSFVRIDAEADYDNVEIDESQLGEALTPIENSDSEIVPNDVGIVNGYNTSVSFGFGLKYQKPNSKISISGSLGFTLVSSVKLTYDLKLFGESYFEFKSETVMITKLAGVEITGTVALPKEYSELPIAKIPIGPFVLSMNVNLILELSASVGFDITYTQAIVISANSDTGLKKTTSSESDWDMDLNGGIEIKVGLGVSVSLAFGEAAHAHLLKLKVSGDFGLKYNGDTAVVGVWADKHHDCIACTNGEVVFFVSAGITLSINIIKDILDFSFNIANWSVEIPLFDFYISLNKDGFSCGKGSCSRIWYKVDVTVRDKEKNILEGVRVFSDTGVCDANGDGNFTETEMLTNSKGKAVFYFKKGSHSVVAKHDNYVMATEIVNIIAEEKTLTLYMEPDTSSEPDEPIKPEPIYIARGVCGDSVQWKLDDTGILTISGVGSMYDYGKVGNSAVAPWHDWRESINTVIIEDGITYIGKEAFYYCDNLNFYVLPSTISEMAGKNWSESNGTNLIFYVASEYEFDIYFKYTTGGGWWFFDQTDKDSFLNNRTINLRACGEELTAELNFNTGVLKISGSGSMFDYESGHWDIDGYHPGPPWDGLESYIVQVEIDEGVESIGQYAFNCLYQVEHIEIPEGVTTIGDYAFGTCLKSVVIPKSVTGIEEYAFIDCIYDNLTDVYYNGSESEWYSINTLITHGIFDETFYSWISATATIHYNPNVTLASNSAKSNCADIMLNFSIVEPESFTFDSCVSGNSYILLNVSDYDNDFVLTTDNLYYIDQLVADENGTVSASFIPKSNDKRTTTLLIGDFGKGVKVKVLKAGYDYSNCKISITPFTTLSLDYGDEIQLETIVNNFPQGAKIVWSAQGKNVKIKASEDGTTCKVTVTGSGVATVKAMVVDENGKPILNINGNAINATKKIETDGSFWKIIIYFIELIFGISHKVK